MQANEYETLRMVEDRHWWYGILRDLVADELALRLPAQAHVLDAGCGTGGMIQKLRTLHPQWRLFGIDVNETAVRHCHDRGLTGAVQAGEVGALPFASASFDAVLSLDVLYHAEVSEADAMAEMVRVLKPGGVLVINVPAFECLRGAHDAAVCGARRYRACQVRNIVENGMLRIEMISYWNAWLFLPLRLWRLWSRARSRQTTAVSDLRTLPWWLNRLLKTTGRLDAKLCRRLHLPWGSSIFAVASKPISDDHPYRHAAGHR